MTTEQQVAKWRKELLYIQQRINETRGRGGNEDHHYYLGQQAMLESVIIQLEQSIAYDKKYAKPGG